MNNSTKRTVLLIFGGMGHEHSVSVSGAETVLPLIDENEYTTIPVYIRKDGAWMLKNATHTQGYGKSFSVSKLIDEMDTEVSIGRKNSVGGLIKHNGGFIKADVAFPLLHGDYGEDGVVQGALENAGIPYVGCKIAAGVTSLDKAYTKIVAESIGIPTAPWTLAIDGSFHYSIKTAFREAELKLGYPMFVKSAALGSSVGTYRVSNRDELYEAYRRAVELGGKRVLIEAAVDIFCELECAVLLTAERRIFSDPSAIVCESGFYDFEAKYNGAGKVTVTASADVPQDVINRMKSYTEMLSEALGTRHLSRFDFFLTENGELIFNEVNTLPGFTRSSMYLTLIKKSGVPERELIGLLLRDAIKS